MALWLCRGFFRVFICNFASRKTLIGGLRFLLCVYKSPFRGLECGIYHVESVKMTKKSIFRDQFSWKVRTFAQNLCENGLHLGKERALCTRFAPSLSHAFRKGCRSFCCSISHTNCDLERDLMSKSKCTLKLRTIAQTSTIVHLGLSQACVRVWDGVRAFFMPIPIVLPPTRL